MRSFSHREQFLQARLDLFGGVLGPELVKNARSGIEQPHGLIVASRPPRQHLYAALGHDPVSADDRPATFALKIGQHRRAPLDDHAAAKRISALAASPRSPLTAPTWRWLLILLNAWLRRRWHFFSPETWIETGDFII
jgi:hypothetical protein